MCFAGYFLNVSFKYLIKDVKYLSKDFKYVMKDVKYVIKVPVRRF